MVTIMTATDFSQKELANIFEWGVEYGLEHTEGLRFFLIHRPYGDQEPEDKPGRIARHLGGDGIIGVDNDGEWSEFNIDDVGQGLEWWCNGNVDQVSYAKEGDIESPECWEIVQYAIWNDVIF